MSEPVIREVPVSDAMRERVRQMREAQQVSEHDRIMKIVEGLPEGTMEFTIENSDGERH